MAKKVYIDFELRYKEAVANLDEMQKEYTKLEKKVESFDKAVDKSNDSVKENDKSTKKATGSTVAFTGALASLTGGATAAFVAIKAGIVSAVAGFATLRVAVMSSGIGALAIAIISVVQAFKRSEEGQNKFAKIMAMIGAVTDEVLDVLADFGEKIIEVFENPKKAVQPLLDILEDVKDSIVDVFTNPLESIKNFGEILIGNVIMRFKAFVDSLGLAGKAVAALFEGKFDRAARLARSSASSLADAVTGVEDSVDKATDAFNRFDRNAKRWFETQEEYLARVGDEVGIAKKIADARALATIKERDLLVLRAKADRDRAAALEKSVNKEKFSVEERIGFLQEAARIEEEITNKEIEAARLRLTAQVEENKLGKSTKEDLDKEAELRAALIQLETARLTKQKEVTSQIVAFRAEAKAERDAEVNEFVAENVFVPGVGFIPKERYEQMLEDAKARKKEEDDIKAKEDKDAEDRANRIAAMEENIQQRITDAKRKAVDIAIGLFGAETAAGKAALIAKQILAAQEMIQEARKTITLTSLKSASAGAAVAQGTAETAKIGFPQNIPMLIAYALQAAGIISAMSAAVGKSKSVAGSIGAGGGSTPDVGTAAGISSLSAISAPSLPPQFDTVGASGTNQLAQLLGGEQAPIRAFVVSGDVSSAQEMDRNIVSSASIG